MKVLIDLNVMLDFLQRRQPFFEEAACVLDRILFGQDDGVLPAHAITTIHYLLAKNAGQSRTIEVIEWLLAKFEIASCGKDTYAQAIALAMRDFEDAVVSVCASQTGCTFIVTRNVPDFRGSPVSAVSPAAYLASL